MKHRNAKVYLLGEFKASKTSAILIGVLLLCQLEKVVSADEVSDFIIMRGSAWANPVYASQPQEDVNVVVDGEGTVASIPAGIDCGNSCTASFIRGSSVSLTASPGKWWKFNAWGGDCVGMQLTCSVSVVRPTSVWAMFYRPSYVLTINKDGAGSVSSSDGGILCGPDCANDYSNGSNVVLTAIAEDGYVFDSWSGACAGSPGSSCTVLITSESQITARFMPTKRLDVTRLGEGTVASLPEGIDCGVSCVASFKSGQEVQLTATAGAGYRFLSWSGACIGVSNSCVFNLVGDSSVHAIFEKNKYKVKINLSAYKYGSGSVSILQGKAEIGGCYIGAADGFSNSSCEVELEYGSVFEVRADASGSKNAELICPDGTKNYKNGGSYLWCFNQTVSGNLSTSAMFNGY